MSIYVLDTEPEASSGADADEFPIYDASAGAIQKMGLDTLRRYIMSGLVDVTSGTLSATDSAHGGRVVTLNRAAGITVTLPASSGTGVRFHFIIGTTVTSNSTKIQVANASDVMTGTALNAADGGDTAVMFETASTSDTITMDGTTTGGIKGDSVELIDIASNLWWVRVVGSATGTEATPFSAAVS